ncbi:hypothetical protein FRC01_006345 [Tulasnella sp. 417]|nr:hypothetical protein FRC01_006345 [Tulasnella sp. 417]
MTLLRDEALNQSTLPSSDAELHALVDQWNTAQPISQLPPELISHTVALGFPITSYFGKSREGLACRYLKTLASLSAISGTWRKAIIGTPSLWGLLSTNLPLHINRISFERSGSCPLLLEISPSRFRRGSLSDADELLDMTLPHWNRCSHASLWLLTLDRIMAHLSSAAPSLERFHLWTDPFNLPDSTPINLFGGCARRLQDVLIYGMPMVWDSEVFRGLRKLSLEQLCDGAISVDDVLGLLTVSPLLEWFDIADSEVEPSRFSAAAPTWTLPVQFLSLKTIKFDNIRVGAVGNILQCIRAPNCEAFWLVADGQIDNPFDPNEFLDQSLGHFSAFMRSTLDFYGSSKLCLLRDRIQWICSSPQGLDPPYFSVDISAIKLNSSIPWIAQLLGQGVDQAHRLTAFSKLVELDAENLAGVERLSLIPNVRTLKMYVARQSTELIFSLLGGTNETIQSSAFPGLEVLQLASASEWPFLDLERMLIRRYGEPRRGACPMRIVLTPALSNPLSGPGNKRIQFDHIVRIRTSPGVESVTLESSFGQDGMPACIYDDAPGK